MYTFSLLQNLIDHLIPKSTYKFETWSLIDDCLVVKVSPTRVFLYLNVYRKLTQSFIQTGAAVVCIMLQNLHDQQTSQVIDNRTRLIFQDPTFQLISQNPMPYLDIDQSDIFLWKYLSSQSPTSTPEVVFLYSCLSSGQPSGGQHAVSYFSLTLTISYLILLTLNQEWSTV